MKTIIEKFNLLEFEIARLLAPFVNTDKTPEIANLAGEIIQSYFELHGSRFEELGIALLRDDNSVLTGYQIYVKAEYLHLIDKEVAEENNVIVEVINVH